VYDFEVQTINNNFKTTVFGRRFIKTEEGYIGFAPENCKKGDLITVLPGGDVPYVLRPKRNALIDSLQ
jgi:hypothetical protein